MIKRGLQPPLKRPSVVRSRPRIFNPFKAGTTEAVLYHRTVDGAFVLVDK